MGRLNRSSLVAWYKAKRTNDDLLMAAARLAIHTSQKACSHPNIRSDKAVQDSWNGKYHVGDTVIWCTECSMVVGCKYNGY